MLMPLSLAPRSRQERMLSRPQDRKRSASNAENLADLML
jgi:hypothetical protein